jgi:folate-binding protein YgfZ
MADLFASFRPLPPMPSIQLNDRALIDVSGPDAEHFLQNILTTDLDQLQHGQAKPGALLAPQGKILFDFLISRLGDDGFRLDCRADAADDFVRRLMLYRLRAKADISRQEQPVIQVSLGNDSDASENESTSSEHDSIRVVDTRFRLEPVFRTYGAALPPPLTPPLKGEGNANASESPSPLRGGVRGGDAGIEGTATDAYTALRIANGVAESGADYQLGDVFPHDVLLDQTGGVGFSKGCYVGQEVVSRMQHRGTARRRVLLVEAADALPSPGTELTVDGRSVGTLGSSAGNRGLAIARIDRVKTALDEGKAILAGDVPVSLSIPGWATFTFPQSPSAEDA